MDDTNDFWGEPISVFTRKEAIEDGSLRDLSVMFPDLCRQVYKFPLACTAAVWNLIERAVHNKEYHNDYKGVVWDLLYMSQRVIVERINEAEHIFEVIIQGAGHSSALVGNPAEHRYRFRILCGAGDSGEGVLTILLPNED
ncbi:DUF6573 family protein [Geotalea sp. SG265]|uniref:DUF6573 family protein n=1 Tax=Geotalea sp. SG265 TaxID=2922867 RepID=UPI001FAEB7F8|nr:DUF6573 family protein [Geotalea sp. SG265]